VALPGTRLSPLGRDGAVPTAPGAARRCAAPLTGRAGGARRDPEAGKNLETTVPSWRCHAPEGTGGMRRVPGCARGIAYNQPIASHAGGVQIDVPHPDAARSAVGKGGMPQRQPFGPIHVSLAGPGHGTSGFSQLGQCLLGILLGLRLLAFRRCCLAPQGCNRFEMRQPPAGHDLAPSPPVHAPAPRTVVHPTAFHRHDDAGHPEGKACLGIWPTQ
jgi:hypothetical protein